MTGSTTSDMPEPTDVPAARREDGPRTPVAEPERAGPPPTRIWPVAGSIALGLLTVLYGLLVMSLRPAALATIAVLAGIALIVGGITQLALANEVERSWRWLAYAGGVVSLIAGITAFVWPALTLLVLAVLLAWSFVIHGVVRIVGAVSGRDRDLWWLGLLAGAVELLLGLWALGAPGREVLLLVNLIGIYLVIAGVDTVVTALAGRPRQREAR